MKEVVVLEAQDRIGGRLNTVPINGAFIERGAQWVHGQGKNPLYKFCLEKNVRKTKKHKDKKTERQKDRKTERQKDRKTERQKVHFSCFSYLTSDEFSTLTPHSTSKLHNLKQFSN